MYLCRQRLYILLSYIPQFSHIHQFISKYSQYRVVFCAQLQHIKTKTKVKETEEANCILGEKMGPIRSCETGTSLNLYEHH